MRRFIASLTILISIFCFVLQTNAAEDTTPPPRLVVVIVVDQLSTNLFDRLTPLFTGGFKTFSDRGFRFRNAHHDHALTQTGPGHFVIMSGRHPGPGGVPANEFYDRSQKRIVYCAEDTEAKLVGSKARGVSYRTVDATALGDWMKDANPGSRVYSVAGKDRAAILLGGRRPDGAFWFDPRSGEFTTSSYYADTLPAFVREFNQRHKPGRDADLNWNRLMKDESIYLKYAGTDDAPGENLMSDEEDSPVFPHRGGFGRLASMPWMDAQTLTLAKTVVESARLGDDTAPDLLAVSLSAFDVIGHTFGPNSQESMDAALRIDRELAAFIQFIERTAGRENIVMVLTSDHGVLPLVEWLQARGTASARVSAEVKAFRDRLFEEFQKKYEDAKKLFLFRGQENIHFDHDELARRRIPAGNLYAFVKTLASTETWIVRVYDRDELRSGKKLDAAGERVRHSFHSEKGADLYIIPKRWLLTSGASRRGTNHGTPYDYDSHVPLIILWPGFRETPAAVDRPARTVDLAPTLAELLGIRAPQGLDGAVLEEFRKNR